MDDAGQRNAACTCWVAKVRKSQLCPACAAWIERRTDLEPIYADARADRIPHEPSRKSR